MPHLPPEILGHIFRLIKETGQGSDLDLLTVSLVCTLWHMEARPLVDRFLTRVVVLILWNRPGNRRFVRLCSLLAESLRYGLSYCDHILKILISLPDLNNDVLACVAAIHQVVRLKPPGLHHIEIHNGEHVSSAAIVELLDVIFPPGEVASITQLTIYSNKRISNDVTVHMLERLGPTLRNVSLFSFQFDATLLEALGRCHGLECLSASKGQLPGSGTPPAPPGAVSILAAALPNLTSLKFSMMRWNKEAHVSDGQLREIVTRLPGLVHLAVDVDFTVNDECLRFVMRHAKKMEVFELVGCEGFRGEGVWTENDVKWRGLRKLVLRGARESSSLTRLLQQECPGLVVDITARYC